MIHLHPRLTRTHTVLTGRKNAHTSSKTLQIHKVFPAAFSSSGHLSAPAKLLAPDSDGFSSDFWLLRRRCVVTHQDEKGKKRRKDTLSGVCALVNRGYIYIITQPRRVWKHYCVFFARRIKNSLFLLKFASRHVILSKLAGLVYRYYSSFPSWLGGFDSRTLLHIAADCIVRSVFCCHFCPASQAHISPLYARGMW